MSKRIRETYSLAGHEPAPPKAAAPISFSALAESIRRLLHTLGKWNDRAAQRRRLLALDDRMLADMGIGRIEAWNEGTKPFWRD